MVAALGQAETVVRRGKADFDPRLRMVAVSDRCVVVGSAKRRSRNSIRHGGGPSAHRLCRWLPQPAPRTRRLRRQSGGETGGQLEHPDSLTYCEFSRAFRMSRPGQTVRHRAAHGSREPACLARQHHDSLDGGELIIGSPRATDNGCSTATHAGAKSQHVVRGVLHHYGAGGRVARIGDRCHPQLAVRR